MTRMTKCSICRSNELLPNHIILKTGLVDGTNQHEYAMCSWCLKDMATFVTDRKRGLFRAQQLTASEEGSLI